MNKEQLVGMGLTDEQADKVIALLGGNFVPKSRFDEVNAEKNQLKATVTQRDEQLETLKKSSEAVDTLKQQISDLQTANTEKEKEHAAEIKRLKRQSLDEQLLSEAKAKNVTAAKALLSKIDDGVDDEGYKALRQQQITALTADEKTKFLFGDAEGVKFTGAKPGESGDGGAGGSPVNPFGEKSYDVEAQAKLFRENPEQARALAKAANIRLI